jgi:formylglycine-generating enzyme required for sulfatase activity
VRFPQFIAVTWLALTCALAPAHAEKRVALAIGNDRYPNLSANEQLQKAVNDARAVGGALKQLGFEVMFGENVGRQALVDRIDAFARRLSAGDTAFFFFSGHGVSLGGANYILPADIPDVEADQESRLARTALAEHDIVSDLQARGVRVAVVVLDACRTNPFARAGSKGVGGERGLAPPPQVRGVFSLYAAASGQAARDRLSDDDRNPNSVFSRVLVPALTQPGLDLTALAFDVREEVARVAKTAGYVQEPSYYDGTIGGRVYLAGLPPAREQTAAVSDAERMWGVIQNTTSLAALDEFLRQYSNTPIGAIAQARREELAKEQAGEPAKPAAGPQTAAIAPPVTPAVPAGDPCGELVTASFPSRCAAPLTAAQERALKPKDTFRECENCPEMVVVPAGRFTMGSPKDEQGRYDDEGPQHVVTISRPFAAGKFHVTVDQYAAFVRETGYRATSKCWTFEGGKSEERADRSWRNPPGFAQEGSHPVVCLSWDDAKAYVEWLARKTRKPYRLLSETEWEYAARGRTSPGAYPRFWFGNDEKDLCQYGNGADQKARDSIEWWPKDWSVAPCNDGYAYTSPAGHYKPNAFGLYDMFGNAWQWTADCYHDSYNGAPADGSAWTSVSCGSGRVIRGASWGNDSRGLRAANRSRYATENYYYFGFRLARSLPP